MKYYFDPDTGISKRWSQKIDGKWYYFDSSYRMKAGWVTWSDGTKSYFHPDSSARRGPHRLAQLQRREVLLRFFDWQKSSLGTEN